MAGQGSEGRFAVALSPDDVASLEPLVIPPLRHLALFVQGKGFRLVTVGAPLHLVVRSHYRLVPSDRDVCNFSSFSLSSFMEAPWFPFDGWRLLAATSVHILFIFSMKEFRESTKRRTVVPKQSFGVCVAYFYLPQAQGPSGSRRFLGRAHVNVCSIPSSCLLLQLKSSWPLFARFPIGAVSIQMSSTQTTGS